MKNYNIENLKTLNKNAWNNQVKSTEIKISTDGIMDGYFQHFREIMAITGITNFKSATIFSADLPAYWDEETQSYKKCSRNPVSSEKGQGIKYNFTAPDRTKETDARRKVKNIIGGTNGAESLGIDWKLSNKDIKVYKDLLDTITAEKEKQEAEIDKEIAEKVKAILLTVKNAPDSKKPALLEKLGKFEVAIRTTETKATEIKSKKPATKKVA